MNELTRPSKQKTQVLLRLARRRFKPIHLLYSFYALVMMAGFLIKAMANS